MTFARRPVWIVLTRRAMNPPAHHISRPGPQQAAGAAGLTRQPAGDFRPWAAFAGRRVMELEKVVVMSWRGAGSFDPSLGKTSAWPADVVQGADPGDRGLARPVPDWPARFVTGGGR